MTAQEYLEQLAQTAGLSADDKAAVLKVATANEKFAKSLEEGVMMRSDYSRNLDSLKAEKQKAADYYQQLVTWKAEQDAAYQVQQPQQPVVTGDFVTKKDLDTMRSEYQKELDRREQVNISLLKDGMRLASQHAVEFKEPLDTEALAQLAVDQKLTLRQAYDAYVGPRRTKAQEESFAQRLAAAKEEGKREFASTHHIPIDTVPREVPYGRPTFEGTAALADYDGMKQQGRLTNAQSAKLRESFVEAYNSTPSGASTT